MLMLKLPVVTLERFHIRLESRGIVVPSHNSSARLAYLRRTGLDYNSPDRYLAFAFAPENTLVEAEMLIRNICEFTGGYDDEVS